MAVSTLEMHRRRLFLVAAVLFAFGVLVTIRLVQWQVLQHEELLASSVRIQSKTTEIPAHRGEILDRNGHILAISLRDDEAAGDPEFFKAQSVAEQEYIVSKAAPILGMDADKLRQQLTEGEGHYIKLQESVPLTVSQALKDAGASLAISVVPTVRRVYPSNALLAQTLGFLNAKGYGAGIEGSYNEQLAGVAGEKLFEAEAYGAGLAKVPEVRPAQEGADITLTVDINVQYMAERALENALSSEHTLTGTVIVMKPKTGEILAIAGRPTFDPNHYSDVQPEVWNNPAVSSAWEPGSIFKILTLSAALDAGKISPSSTFIDRGTMKFHGLTVSNQDGKANGTITPAQILQYSSNVGTVQVATVLSNTAFYTYTHAFGIGVKTGIDLPGEVEGSMRIPGDPEWSQYDLAAQSYGQGLATTPIQMAAAVAAVANRGIMMRPYVVATSESVANSPDGPGPLRRVISSQTAAEMTDMLVSVVEKTVTQAQVSGYHLAGKTGTALIPEENYDPDKTIASFIGYGPAEDPQFLILVRIDRPQVHETGAEVAAPVFKTIAQWLLNYMRIPPYDLRAQR
jgi:cell division protein FtsI/penicillin-binding protein 2